MRCDPVNDLILFTMTAMGVSAHPISNHIPDGTPFSTIPTIVSYVSYDTSRALAFTLAHRCNPLHALSCACR